MRSLPLLLGPALLAACSYTPVQEINKKYQDVLEQRFTNYKIKPGDMVDFRFYNQDVDLNQSLLVLPDGRFDPFFMDDVVVAGKTVKELEADIAKYYAEQVRSPEISVHIVPAGETIIMEGEVLKPAPQPLTVKMTLMQAMGNAGGYKITACLHQVILRRSYLDPLHPDVYRINLRDYFDMPEELFLLPNDHIIVQQNLWILARDYVREYVWGWIPPFAYYFAAPAAAAF